MSGALPRKGILLLTSLLLLAWPGVIWLGLAHNSLRWLLPLMALLLYLRLRQTRRQAGPLRIVTQVVALAGIALCVASTLLKTHQLLLFYPLVVNAVMLAGPHTRASPPRRRRALYPSGHADLVPVFYRQWQYRPLDGAVR